MSNILAINAGSSSLKFQFIKMPEEEIITKGNIERIGLNDSIVTVVVDGMKHTQTTVIENHEAAVQILFDTLTNMGIIKDLEDIHGIGHRIVHGGEMFSHSVLIDDKVLADIEKLTDLAPLHNPANITGVKAFKRLLPNVPAVAVFDTAFHQTMPESSFLYSLPYHYYKDYGIRKYGFHGTSHKYVSGRAAELLERPLEHLRLISCHLGNGASIAAIEGGKSIDTSMGFTPLAGVTMGTRSGDIDPALIPFIMEKTNKTADEVLEVLNKKSGMLGVSGLSSDLRDIETEAAKGNERAELALEVFASRIHKYIGSYAARMKGLDGIIFTAGIGENSSAIRARVLKGLEFMGIYWDPNLNQKCGEELFIHYPHSPVKVMVIPTNEEVMIARDVMKLIS